jgi:hypothetical protein
MLQRFVWQSLYPEDWDEMLPAEDGVLFGE